MKKLTFLELEQLPRAKRAARYRRHCVDTPEICHETLILLFGPREAKAIVELRQPKPAIEEVAP